MMDRCSPQSCVSTRGRYVSKQEDRWDPGLPPVLRSSPPKRCRGGAAPSIAAPCASPGRTFQYDSGAGRVGDPAVGSLLPAALSARSRQQCNADIPSKWGSAQMNAFDLIQLTPKLNSDAPIPNPPPISQIPSSTWVQSDSPPRPHLKLHAVLLLHVGKLRQAASTGNGRNSLLMASEALLPKKR